MLKTKEKSYKIYQWVENNKYFVADWKSSTSDKALEEFKIANPSYTNRPLTITFVEDI